ncbi:MAG: SMI1/KNR4 family protein, partial [Planctomycetales bacterium]|nr:SMI1/KNR4 family protein [Planctomycetales bacterium]
MFDTSRLIEHWRLQGIECPVGATESAIRQFEASRGLKLPADMRGYFLAVNGMGERGTYDGNFFSFWQLSDLISVADDLPGRSTCEPDAVRYIMFADHSVDLPTYAIRLSHRDSVETPV